VILRLDAIEKRFGETTAVTNLSLEVAPGELLTLLGPSGCGKTTTLRMIAGFETPTAGRILLDGRDITKLPPQKRGFGMVFQNYALFPHLDVFENVAFGLKGQGTPRAEIVRRVQEALALVDLAGYGKRKVQQLSGGQQQRVALARALAPEPRILLLDEPLSNLDASLRERTRAELRTLLERLGITAIFVTHDQEEAFDLSDRIAIMEGGRLQQLGTPEALYRQPANPFVATFLGRANFLDVLVLEREGEWLICELAGGARWRVRWVGVAGWGGATEAQSDGDNAQAERRDRAGQAPAGPNPGEIVRIMVRPESLWISPAEQGRQSELQTSSTTTAPAGIATAELPATILERRFAGPLTSYRLRAGDIELTAQGNPGDGRPGERVWLRLAPDAVPLAYHHAGATSLAPPQKVNPNPSVTVGT
jgi:ABC-type Fe3+/spermidine/putrescine transport system ATPase subunit